MRRYEWVIRGLLVGAAAATLAACEDEVVRPARVVAVVAETRGPQSSAVASPPRSVAPSVAPRVLEVAPESVQDSAADSEPSDLVVNARRALDLGELDRALKLARLAVGKEPKRTAAWNTLGRTYLRRGRHVEATKAFERAVELNPDSSFAHNNLGLVMLYDARYAEAAEHLEAATCLEPVEGYMWNNLGMAYEHLDMLKEARLAYRQAQAARVPAAGRNLARLRGVVSISVAQNALEDATGDSADD